MTLQEFEISVLQSGEAIAYDNYNEMKYIESFYRYHTALNTCCIRKFY